MDEYDFDDGLVHGHSWATGGGLERQGLVLVADTSAVTTPSSVVHDDRIHAD